jgi:hypothetical protein
LSGVEGPSPGGRGGRFLTACRGRDERRAVDEDALWRGSSERRVRASRFRAFWTDPANPMAYAFSSNSPITNPSGSMNMAMRPSHQLASVPSASRRRGVSARSRYFLSSVHTDVEAARAVGRLVESRDSEVGIRGGLMRCRSSCTRSGPPPDVPAEQFRVETAALGDLCPPISKCTTGLPDDSTPPRGAHLHASHRSWCLLGADGPR